MSQLIGPRNGKRSVCALFFSLLIAIGTAIDVEAGTVPAARFDFDGDRKADLSIFRSSNAGWYIAKSTGGYHILPFGLEADEPVAADYDGDGKVDIAVYRGGVWYQLLSTNNSVSVMPFGLASDLPVPADFDGDGAADVAVYRPSDGVWHVVRSTGQSYFSARFGLSEDLPVPADYDGDGKADISVFRPSDGNWYRLNSSTGSFSVARFGSLGDVPVRGNFDGDAKDDIAVWRPTTGVWYISRSTDGGATIVPFGLFGDTPVPADYDGDNKTDIAVYRPLDGVWHRMESLTSSYRATAFGMNGDLPIPLGRRGASVVQCSWFVATDGSRTNPGTQASPWSLPHALTGAGGAIRPGDTVCIKGGTYPGRFAPSLNGTAAQPIIVRAYPGHRVILDGGLQVSSLSADTGSGSPFGSANITLASTANVQIGSIIRIGNENMRLDSINYTTRVANVVRGWGGSCSSGTCPSWPSGSAVTTYFTMFDVGGSNTWYWGLEITNTGHVSRIQSSGLVDLGAGVTDACSTGCKLINNVVHNTAGGIGSFNNSSGNEYYGNISFLNGWDNTGGGGDPGRGHGMYLQNQAPTSPAKKVTDNISFSNFGYNLQSYSDNGGVHNLEFTGNIFFESSNPVPNGPTFDALIGGGNQTSVGWKFVSNYTYNPTINGVHRGTDVVGWGNSPCTSPVVRDNYIASGNFELSTGCTTPTVTGNTFYSFFSRAGSFPSNTYHGSRPTTNSIFVRPNMFEPGRANIAVFNWNRLPAVTVDLRTAGLQLGQRFQIRDVQNFNGPPVYAGTYTGARVTVPMTNTTMAPVYGTVNKNPNHSDIEFGAFVVLPY